MKLVVAVRLFPAASQEAALRDTLALCNRAANMVSARAFETRVTEKQSLQRLVYGDLKEMGLSAQPAIHVARKVAGAYALGGRRPASGERVPSDRALHRPDGEKSGYGLMLRTPPCDIPEPDLAEPDGFTGVDLGIANIATTDDGTRHSGKHLNRHRHRARHLRRKLQAKGTRSAKRLLRKRSRKEARFAADTNHVIAKRIVTEAERTGRGIALEDLGGIRGRVRLRKPQRVTLHSRAFAQLGQYIAYKAARAGVPLVYVDPAYTSQMCSSCGHVSKKNRPSQATFCCTSCGFAEHADVNAARNIAARGVADWAVSHAADDAA